MRGASGYAVRSGGGFHGCGLDIRKYLDVGLFERMRGVRGGSCELIDKSIAILDFRVDGEEGVMGV